MRGVWFINSMDREKRHLFIGQNGKLFLDYLYLLSNSQKSYRNQTDVKSHKKSNSNSDKLKKKVLHDLLIYGK